jgi:uncharacterized membrane protein
MLGLLPRTELTPPLYYLLAWVWAQAFGTGEAALRLLSALAGIATVPAMYLTGAKLSSRRVGLAAAALAACNPLLIWYSQEARSYALLVVLATLSLLAFAYAREPHAGWRRFALWGLACALTLSTHYYGALVVAPEAAYLLWVHRSDRRLLTVLGALVVLEAALVPLALTQRTQATWIAGEPLNLRLSQILPQFLLGTGAPARTWLKLAGVAVVALIAWLLARRADARERHTALLFGSFALAGLAMALALIVLGTDELITRNVILVLLSLILVAAIALGARRAGVLGWLGLGTLCAVGLTAAIAVSVDAQLQRPDWRGVARVIAAGARELEVRAVLIERYASIWPLAAYLPHLRSLSAAGATVTELDVVGTWSGTNGSWFCWWGSECNIPPARLRAGFRMPGLHRDGPIEHTGQFSILRLQASAPLRLTGPEVRAAGLRARLPGPYAVMFTPVG